MGPVKLLDDDDLERSAVVANCRMNRERNLTGSNGYLKELGFHPLDFLREQGSANREVAWLDLCCGTGRALIEAARIVRSEKWGRQVSITGVDLVGMFHRPEPGLEELQLVETSLRTWIPDRPYDLITCVHGLHYVGDKLAILARAVSWLAEEGTFAANLDLANLKFAENPGIGRGFATELQRYGFQWNRRRRLIMCHGAKFLCFPYRYLGASDQAGPNYTGQPAVDSYYGREESSPLEENALT